MRKTITLQIDEDVLDEIDDLANKMEISRNALVNMQLKALNEGDAAEAMNLFRQMGKALGFESKRKRKKRISEKKAATA